jgi:ElaB/YqjD/DUF883 family membrane-anchored ribosome-binding protein
MPLDLKEPGFSEAEVHESSRTSGDATRQAIAPVLERAREAYGALRNSAADGAQCVEAYVKQSPVKALAIALGAAAIVGMALSASFKRSSNPADEPLE